MANQPEADQPQVMDLTQLAQNAIDKIHKAEGLLKEHKTAEAGVLAAEAAEQVRKLVKLNQQLERTAQGHPQIDINGRAIQTAGVAVQKYMTRKK